MQTESIIIRNLKLVPGVTVRGDRGGGLLVKFRGSLCHFNSWNWAGYYSFMSHIIRYRGAVYTKKFSPQICDYWADIHLYLKLYFVKLQVIQVVILLVVMVMIQVKG